jgi:hypothetical protein
MLVLIAALLHWRFCGIVTRWPVPRVEVHKDETRIHWGGWDVNGVVLERPGILPMKPLVLIGYFP